LRNTKIIEELSNTGCIVVIVEIRSTNFK